MGSGEDDAWMTDVQLSWCAADRALFHDIARFLLSNSPFGWCPDTFAGLGAHLSPLWYRRDAPVLRYIEPTFVPSDVDCVAIGAYHISCQAQEEGRSKEHYGLVGNPRERVHPRVLRPRLLLGSILL